jgi:hypothetical protein
MSDRRPYDHERPLILMEEGEIKAQAPCGCILSRFGHHGTGTALYPCGPHRAGVPVYPGEGERELLVRLLDWNANMGHFENEVWDDASARLHRILDDVERTRKGIGASEPPKVKPLAETDGRAAEIAERLHSLAHESDELEEIDSGLVLELLGWILDSLEYPRESGTVGDAREGLGL